MRAGESQLVTVKPFAVMSLPTRDAIATAACVKSSIGKRFMTGTSRDRPPRACRIVAGFRAVTGQASDAGDSRSLKEFLVRLRQKLVKSPKEKKTDGRASLHSPPRRRFIHLLADALLRHGTLSSEQIFELLS
jgi:hypothetical protein